ncbi:NAD(P)/FAD-dependent oxidoreductase OS=Streptomyces tendae OX=1932 GN=GUR47_22245 PE=3 SV=1 [Streptomyces tendae]
MVKERARILVVGGGYVGMYTALRLQRNLKGELRRGEAEITVVTPDPYMTYQPFLPEAAAGSISPRHVVVPLRRVLGQCDLVVGEAEAIDHTSRTATVTTLATDEEKTGARRITYDELVLAPGSVSRTLPVPGLADHGVGFKTVEEAIGLRNHVLEQMDIASSPATRPCATPPSPSSSSAAATPAWRPSANWRTWPATPRGTTTTSRPRT